MGVRCVVTGQTAEGRSVIFRDSEVEPVRPPLLRGEPVWEFGGEDRWPHLPMTGRETFTGHGFFPPAQGGGYRFAMFSFPPTSFAPPEIDDFEAALAETERQLPGITQVVTEREGFHITDTVDFLYILDGEVELVVGETEDNSERTYLKAGDCVIQNGTHHSWHNRHPERWARLLVVFVAASRKS